MKSKFKMIFEDIMDELGLNDEKNKKEIEKYIKKNLKNDTLKQRFALYIIEAGYIKTLDELKEVFAKIGDEKTRAEEIMNNIMDVEKINGKIAYLNYIREMGSYTNALNALKKTIESAQLSDEVKKWLYTQDAGNVQILTELAAYGDCEDIDLPTAKGIIDLLGQNTLTNAYKEEFWAASSEEDFSNLVEKLKKAIQPDPDATL